MPQAIHFLVSLACVLVFGFAFRTLLQLSAMPDGSWRCLHSSRDEALALATCITGVSLIFFLVHLWWATESSCGPLAWMMNAATLGTLWAFTLGLRVVRRAMDHEVVKPKSDGCSDPGPA